jgi:hypothetical protein
MAASKSNGSGNARFEIINREDDRKTFQWIEYADEMQTDREGNEFRKVKARGDVTVGAACDAKLKEHDDKFPSPRATVTAKVWDLIQRSNPAVEAMLNEGRIDAIPV